MTNKFTVYLRYSDASHKLGGTGDLSTTIYKDVTKEDIFRNFLRVFDKEEVWIMADNCRQSTIDHFKELGLKNIVVTSLGDSGSFKNMINLSIENSTSDDDIVYYTEDDYVHTLDAKKCLIEGLEISHYCTGYDSLDKYKNTAEGGYNPFIAFGGEVTRVILGKSIHYKWTNATTNTFAVQIKTLKEDYDTIMKYCTPEGNRDFLRFCDLWQNKHRILVNTLPGKSAHMGLEMSPFVNFIELLEV
jgi:hypothetical protein